MVVCILFYLNKNGLTEENRTSGLNVKLKKSIWQHLTFFLISKLEKWRVVVMNKRWKFKCRVADNKAYRKVRISYVNCMHKAEFPRFSCW